MSSPRASRTDTPSKRQPARERAARLVAAALEWGRIRLRRAGDLVLASFDDGPESPVAERGSGAYRTLRRRLRDYYTDCEGAQPPDEALRVMADALCSEAERLAPGDGEDDGMQHDAEGHPSVPQTEAGGRAIFVEEHDAPQSQADLLVRLAETAGLELWQTPSGDLHASIKEDGRMEHHPIQSRHLKRWLRRRFFEAHEKAVRSEAVRDALGVLEGRAMAGPEHEIYTRVAGRGGRVYVDLADQERRVVEIAATGWRIVNDSPVRFRRPPGALALPAPVHGGSIADLRPLINIPDDDAWVLLVGFLVGALHPVGPYLVLVLIGERGTAKSTATRLVVCTLDPKDTPLRRPPRDERDLAIGARHGRVVALNNVSHLSPALSDALSTIATEGGFATRMLYTDDEEARFRDRRPFVLNGIPDFVTRGDLADRSVKIVLAPIPPDRRREEKEILGNFDRVLPRVLGALYDAVAHALATIDEVTLPRAPRMADAAKWITAAEPALGWPRGTFLAAFARSLAEAAAGVVEGDPVALALRDLAALGPWRGSAGDLLEKLSARHETAAQRKDWPRSPQGMASALRRSAPELRAVDVEVLQEDRPDPVRRTRLWTVQRVASTAEEATAPIHSKSDDLFPCPHCGLSASDGHECDETVS